MDPVSLAIVAAAAAGVTQAATEHPAQHAYQSLKNALKGRFGDKSEIIRIVNEVEVVPHSEEKRNRLFLAGEAASLGTDTELLRKSQLVMDLLASSRTAQIAMGNYIAQADKQSTASVNINTKRPSATDEEADPGDG